jgi:pimeloyl-ACP methyl ester carboxylesterase
MKPSCTLQAALLAAAAFACLALSALPAAAQTCDRIMEQDSTLNNLVQPPDYRPAPMGKLGRVHKAGLGKKAMILIPGLGFGGDVFASFASEWQNEYTTYAVTLPGFGGTPAPPTPPETTSFGEQTWTNSALAALDSLLASEQITDAVVVGHWLTGTQLAVRLAEKHPDIVRGIVIIAGSARFVPTDTTRMPSDMPLAQRIAGIDRYMAPRWYKMVTRATWDDNNFLPGDYAVNPVRGLRLWREAATPPLHVWVRYLCEFYAQDLTFDLERLTTPTLIVEPGLEGNYFDPGNDYMTAYCRTSWRSPRPTSPAVAFKTIPNARVFIWFDQPGALKAAIAEFFAGLP